MTTTSPPESHSQDPEPPRRGRGWRTIAARAGGLALALALLVWFGRPLWDALLDYRQVSRESEGSAPIGYIGVSLRRTYFDKPSRFFDTSTGRKRLWAAKGADGKPEYYDVTEAAFEVDKVAGGFGRDSIPGIDYPLFEPAGSPTASKLHPRQPVFGLALRSGPRAYPRDLLRKIEVVNDEADGTPLAIVFDRRSDQAWFYDRRIDDRAVTFGTTGYAIGATDDPKDGTPLLYDRKTRSLWLPEPAALACASGPLKGTRLPAAAGIAPEATSWSAWTGKHPETRVLLGSDRDGDRKPIPPE
jgi:hypothetical protein